MIKLGLEGWRIGRLAQSSSPPALHAKRPIEEMNKISVVVPLKLTLEDLLAAAEQLPPAALEDFIQRLLALQTQRKMLAENLPQISAQEARQAADRAIWGDEAEAALSSDEPMLMPTPTPRWRIPYRQPNGTLLAIVEVEAHTGAVLLTEEKRGTILAQVEQLAATANVSKD